MALGLLMFIAYHGYSVMEKMVVFIKNYFPVFLLGAILGEIIEMSGIAELRVLQDMHPEVWE